MNRLTFVIPNFNYREFVGRAIQSALAVDWPDLEVIVVDDGSTDGSVDVISRFEERVHLIKQRNQGPRVACNTGYAASTGDWIIFLDSDDLVSPEIAHAIHARDRAGLSKMQFQMQRIDANDEVIGNPFPAYRNNMTPEQIRGWMRSTASYPTPPGSGNAHSRQFLERLFPLDDRCGDATDSACLAAAPFLGDIETVKTPGFSYRLHGRNRSYLLGDIRRFEGQLVRALQRHRFAQEIDGRLNDSDWLEPLFRGRHLLQLRIAHSRLVGGRSPIPEDSRSRMFRDSVKSFTGPGPEHLLERFVISLWSLVTLLLPRRLATLAIHARFVQPDR